MWTQCRAALLLFRRFEILIFIQQLGSALFDTALQMVVKDRCANATDAGTPNLSTEDSRQKAMSNFYMTYNLILKLAPILPALLLARIGDRGWRRVPIIVPLTGYLLSRLTLLMLVVFHWPLEAMFAGAAFYGVFGGFCSYWAGVMTLASLMSTPEDRSKVMMRVELIYGLGAILGSLVSGHLFLLYTPNLGQGTILLIVSTVMFVLCLIHATVLLQVKEVGKVSEEPEGDTLVSHISDELPLVPDDVAPPKWNIVNLVLLFTAAILYDVAVGGAMEILVSFVMKEPLNWDATQVGYGNTAGHAIFFTSFLGVMVMRRWFSDASLILIGMVSFASGIYFMSFVTATYMFYLARSLTLFGLIPLPTIRSLLSQQVQGNSYGINLTFLQLALKFAGSAYIPAYTKIYQGTLDWFPGFVFTLSSIIAVLGMIPISIVGCRTAQKRHYERIQED
ncbi:solute carrier family 46 member 2 [Genypterus blacodes]|uniref:solute carrier family 46 member 2 n=1 Tax=Genypterus blacodes TaxID=154954 RepID=UPI003F77097D